MALSRFPRVERMHLMIPNKKTKTKRGCLIKALRHDERGEFPATNLGNGVGEWVIDERFQK